MTITKGLTIAIINDLLTLGKVAVNFLSRGEAESDTVKLVSVENVIFHVNYTKVIILNDCIFIHNGCLSRKAQRLSNLLNPGRPFRFRL